MRSNIRKRRSAFLTVGVAAANFYSLKNYAEKLQILATTAKLLLMLIIIGTGIFYLIFEGHFSSIVYSTWGGAEKITVNPPISAPELDPPHPIRPQ